MDAYVIETRPEGAESTELIQAGDDEAGCATNLSMLMLVGSRILAVHFRGNVLDGLSFGTLMMKAARTLTINRLAVSLGLTMEKTEELFGGFYANNAQIEEYFRSRRKSAQ